jgi:hypothetical protein
MDAVFREAEYPGNGDSQPAWHGMATTAWSLGSHWIMKTGPEGLVELSPVMELNRRPSPYHIAAGGSIEVIQAGQSVDVG